MQYLIILQRRYRTDSWIKTDRTVIIIHSPGIYLTARHSIEDVNNETSQKNALKKTQKQKQINSEILLLHLQKC